MFDQRVIVTIAGPEDDLREIVFATGAILVDSTQTGKWGPQATVSEILAVRLEDRDPQGNDPAAFVRGMEEGDPQNFDPAAFVRGLGDARRGAVCRYVAGVVAKQQRARLAAHHPDPDEERTPSDV